MNFHLLGRVGLVTLILALVLVTPVIAVHTVEELYQQGERTASELAELRKSVDDLNTTLQNTINSTGIKLILILSLEYVILNCFYYLAKIIYNHRNKARLKKQRDELNLSLQREAYLLKHKNLLLARELTLLNDSHNLLLSVISGVKEESPTFRFLLFAGIALMLLMFSLTAGLSVFGEKFISPVITQYLIFVPAVLALFFAFIGAKLYKEDINRLKQTILAKDATAPPDLGVELVDVPTPEELKKTEPTPKPSPEMQGILDRLRHLKGEKTEEEKKAEAEAKKEAEADKKLAEQMKASLPEGAEVKVGNGLVSVTAPIKPTDFTIVGKGEVAKRMDLPDVEAEEAPKFVMPEDAKQKIFNLIASSPKALMVSDIMRALGYSGRTGALVVAKTLCELKKLGKISNKEGKNKKNYWSVTR
jgi:hypothetical protein